MKAKSILVLSLVLNAVLLAVCGRLLSLRSKHPASTALVEAKFNPAGTPLPEPARQEASSAAAEPFHWSQLETGDYAAYIRNLRAIGCPDGTVRDILAAAVGHDYDKRRADLQAQHAKGGMDTVALQDAIAKLWAEQNDLLARLFGTQGSFGADGSVAHAAGFQSAGAPGSSPGPPTDGERLAQIMRSSTLETAPLVFVEPDPAWGLTPAQLDIWYQTRENFAEAIGGEGQDPRDPAYHQRWAEAKAEADQRLKTLFGMAQFSKWQIQARSQMPAPPAGK